MKEFTAVFDDRVEKVKLPAAMVDFVFNSRDYGFYYDKDFNKWYIGLRP